MQDNINRCLFISLPGIGDTLMLTPTIKLLKEKHSECHIDVLVMFKGSKYILDRNSYVDGIYYIPIYHKDYRQSYQVVKELRSRKYDISFMAYPSYRREYHLIQRIIGSKKRVSHRYKNGYFWEFHFLNNYLVDIDEQEHNVINNLRLLKVLGINWEMHFKRDEIAYSLSLDPKDLAFGKEYIEALGWAKKDIIGIHPGSTNSPIARMRRWPITNYAELTEKLIKRGKKIIIFIGPEEMDLGLAIRKLNYGYKDSINLVENVSFGQSLGILFYVKGLICNDNGFGHVANGLGVKTVSLFGPTNQKWTCPYNKKLLRSVTSPITPWYRFEQKYNIPRGVTSGMDLITVDEVVSVANFFNE